MSRTAALLRRGLLALVCALAPATAAAQRDLPSERVPPDQRAQFSLCRAALLYHLQQDEPADPRVTHAMAQAMIEQVSFVMFETVKNAPSGTLAESRRSLGFIEQFFLDFGRTINAERERLADRDTREAILMECQPFIWRIVSEDIDYLIRWREKAIAAPADSPSTP